MMYMAEAVDTAWIQKPKNLLGRLEEIPAVNPRKVPSRIELKRYGFWETGYQQPSGTQFLCKPQQCQKPSKIYGRLWIVD